MDDVLSARKENQSRFDDLCNSELVDKAASLHAAAMFAADRQKAIDEQNKALAQEPHAEPDHNTNIFIMPSKPVTPEPVRRSPPAKTSEEIEQVYFPDRNEREAFGNKSRNSPTYYRGPIQPVEEAQDEEEPEPTNQEKRFVHLVDYSNVDRDQEGPWSRLSPQPVRVPNEPIREVEPVSAKDLVDLKEPPPQWDTASLYEDEEQQAKVCYLIKIEELKEEGIPMYKQVGIDTDLPAIKLCHAFMSERANRRNLLKRGKGLVKFSADLFGKAADFLQKKSGDDDSTEWRNHFKTTVESGLHDIQIRRVVNKHENLQLPEEMAIVELMLESKSKFDEQRKRQRRLEHEAAAEKQNGTINEFAEFMGKVKLDNELNGEQDDTK